jgi:TRAP-type mannitol/chloroaromatic compound transport system substrate-binding protein
MSLRMRTLANGTLAVMLAACGSAATPAPTKAPTAAPSAAASVAASPAGSAVPTLAADGQKVTIKLLDAWAPDSVFSGPVRILQDTLKATANGRITITQAGPDVVPPTEQITAVARGVYDILYTVPLYYTGIQPEGEAIYFISGKSSCAAYRKAGALDAYDQAHRKGVGVFFLGCGGGGAHGATFLLKKPITSVDEFKGMKFRGFGLYTRVLDALGASSVTLAAGDVYAALERGVVDGAAFPNLGLFEFGLTKVTPYIVMPPYLPFRYGFYMNPAAFDKLPADIQKYLQATILDLEDDFDAYWVKARDDEAAKLSGAGMKEVRLSAAESTRLDKIIHTELWKFIVEKSPVYGPVIKSTFEKVEPPTS